MFAQLDYAPTVVLEGDFQQLPPPTFDGADTRQSKYWRRVQLTGLVGQHRCNNTTMEFANICRYSVPSSFRINEFFDGWDLGDADDLDTCIAAARFIEDGFIVAATRETVRNINGTILHALLCEHTGVHRSKCPLRVDVKHFYYSTSLRCLGLGV